MLDKEDLEFYLEDLKSKFSKINPKDYYLSYSGGKDSHFLLWFIKDYAKIKGIEIVGCNTYMEHAEIRKRIYKYSDRVLLPDMKPFDIKQKYGIPCFSKEQDYFIYSYQNSLRKGKKPARTTLEKVNRTYHTGFFLSKKASEYVLSGNAHKITHLCCMHLKKEPFHAYEKETGRKAILGIRGGESALRKVQYKTCFTKQGKFTPIHDLSNEMEEAIIKEYNIEVPEVYEHIDRTGCMGCPYGSYKHDTEKELMLINDKQFEFVCKYFKESYEILGINIDKIREQRKQLTIFDYI